MQRSSEFIGCLATALAKAQVELSNPEKSLVATIRPSGPGEAERSFRYAPLSSRLEIVRNVSFPRGVLEVFMAEPIGGGRGVDDRLRIDYLCARR